MPISDYTLTIKLKQHTPIIHFQHDQAGATLRATEVKAKLDRFLIAKTGKDWDDIDVSWKIGGKGGKQKGLAYKLKISAGKIYTRDIETERYDSKKGRMVEDKHPCFFGNMKERNPKRFSESRDHIHLNIFTLKKELNDFISKHLSMFFIYQNFGTRQSKGFGCFLPVSSPTFPSNFYSFSVPSKNIKTVFATIELFYKTLRGGVNGAAHPNPPPKMGGFVQGFYLKPMVFQYAAKNNIKWEKRAIKETYFNGKLSKQKKDKNNKKEIHFERSPLHYEKGEPKIVRDWLGISTDQTWMKYPEENIKKTHTKQNGKDVSKENTIARMKSPIIFKPVEEIDGYRVYFYAQLDESVSNTLKEATFRITANDRDDLELGMWKDFNMNTFFDFAFASNRLEQSIKYRDDHNKAKAKAIKTEIIRIYNEIRNYQGNG